MSEQHETAESSVPHHHVDDSFTPFLAALQGKVNEILAEKAFVNDGGRPWAVMGHSTVTGDELYAAYLESFPTQALRQDHTCSCCKHFFREYGNLLVLDRDGSTQSLLFHDSDAIPLEYLSFVAHARALLDNTKIERVHFAASPLPTIGQLRKGNFMHFSFQLPYVHQFPNKFISSSQNSAEIKEDVRLLTNSLFQWNDEVLNKAAAMFQHDADLSRTSFASLLSTFRLLRQVVQQMGQDHAKRHNYIIAEVLQNRKGLARIGQTVLGEFLNGLAEGDRTDAQVKTRFLTMISPKDYMRPKAAPASQTVQQAEKIFSELGLRDSLRRRSLRRDELDGHTIWDKPQEAAQAAADGIFGHIQTKDQTSKSSLPEIDGGRLSLAALMDKIDDEVSKVELFLHAAPTKAFSSFTTEAVAGSRPILNWDHEDRRNPVAPYTYVEALYPQNWGVMPGWNEVVAITDRCQRWESMEDRGEDESFDPHFVLATGYDMRTPNLPLFPATLRPELHEVRSVIEAYCRTATLEDTDKGLVVWSYPGGDQKLRLTTKDAVVTYTVASEK